MSKALASLSIVSVFLLCDAAMAHRENPMLKFTMKAISRDLEEVWIPAKRPDPADVLDGAILNAIARARTAVFALQLVIDRKDTEMLPGGVDELPPAEKAAKLVQFVDFLNQAKAKLVLAEQQLLDQFKIADAERRDFRPNKQTLTELEAIIVDSHRVFRPQNPGPGPNRR